MDDTPKPEKKPEPAIQDDAAANGQAKKTIETALPTPQPRLPQPQGQTTPKPPASPAPPEDESDDPDAQIPTGVTCKRRGCNATYDSEDRSSEKCVHHPGQAIFHEGSKGYTCCKRRVLEFDEFLKIEGCKMKERHCFVGKKREEGKEEELDNVR